MFLLVSKKAPEKVPSKRHPMELHKVWFLSTLQPVLVLKASLVAGLDWFGDLNLFLEGNWETIPCLTTNPNHQRGQLRKPEISPEGPMLPIGSNQRKPWKPRI